MSQTPFSLTPDFPPVTESAWRQVVEKALKGADFDRKLTTRLYDGITLQPLYGQDAPAATADAAGLPGQAPYTRGTHALGQRQAGWDIRQEFTHPDVRQVSKEALEDLERGVSSVVLRLDAAAHAGLDPDTDAAEGLAGVDGIMIATADDLDTALAGVLLDICPVALKAGAGAVAAAAMLADVWTKRGVGADLARGAYNIDPVGTLAATGWLPQGLEKSLNDMAAVAARTAEEFPMVTAVGVSGEPWSNAGASEAQELGCMLATGVAYLRAMTDAGIDIDTACRQISFTLPVGTDFFSGIAKLRAARLLWAQVTAACGAAADAGKMVIHAETARRVLSQRDPWVNLLRVTVTSFAAGVGGADSVAAASYESALGLPTAFGRRVARNIQIILQEESHLAKVVDPAGGSWFVETLTRQLAERAWEEFQSIEKAGGIAAVLQDGSLAAALARTWDERRANIARRKDQLTGINEFPNLSEAPVDVAPADRALLRRGMAARLKHVDRTPGFSTLDQFYNAARTGTIGGLTAALGGTPLRIDPLPNHRFAEDFEALRDASDEVATINGTRPSVFLANMGRVAQHTARATYARNFFEAGGIEAISSDGFDSPEAAAAAFRLSGAKIACLCGTDDQYESGATAMLAALKAAGATRLYVAGRPAAEAKAAYDAAGASEYIFMGCDALATLTAAHRHLGVN